MQKGTMNGQNNMNTQGVKCSYYFVHRIDTKINDMMLTKNMVMS